MILTDQPTANLDSKTGESLIEHLRMLNQQRGTISVFSTHDPRLLAHITRTVNLEDGRVVG